MHDAEAAPANPYSRLADPRRGLGLPRRRRVPAPRLGPCTATLPALLAFTIPGFLPSRHRGRVNDAVGEWS